ncbi:hypothetical protein O3M35_003621 [Rhynocoris fuscipes]|uniref:Major facilitator superfamily (MFS) profile domain-containing protein n=1 Tax=Rhynocoris fuscipes TaxID=488301 RepID=A0AAW1CM04_9HEMI
MEGREAVLQDSIGNVGPWQVKIFLLMALLKFPTAWTLLGLIFMGAPVSYTCKDSNEQCVDAEGNECKSWTYNRTVFKETIQTEWDLVCKHKQLVNLAQMTFMVGIMFGTILFSLASDRWGRKKPMIAAGLLQLITGVGTAFIPWYWGFIVLRFAQALAVGGTMTISFVLCMEVLGGKWRTIMATLTHIPFNLGTIIMAVIAYYTREWRQFQLSISLPIAIIILYWWWVPESPRWLLAVGKDKEALAILQDAATQNKRTPPKKIPVYQKDVTEESKEMKKPTVLDLFRTPNMRKKTLVVWVNWSNVGLCFFGLEQYLSNVGGNIFINVAVSGVCIIPGILASIYTMDKIGRKWTLAGGQFTGAISCLIIILLPDSINDVEWWRLGFATLGVTGIAVGFTTLYLYSTELFPTVVRNTGLGSGSMCARIGSMIAPFIASLDQISPMIPPSLFGLTSTIAAFLCLLLPETMNRVLPVTLEDGENFEKGAEKEKSANGNINKGYSEDISLE